ncbi:MAG: site-2 protease family protein [Firmicutes bacterium]|nr:site-2 protease family protein [Bacillota bacterium]
MNFILKGCKVSINFYFFASAVVLAMFDRSGMMLGGIISALMHESGHLAAMLIIPHQHPKEISITPFGLKIQNNSMAEFARGRVVVLAAGSVVNLILAACLFRLSPRLAAMNFVLGTMNLLPVESFDGGGILKLALSWFIGSKKAEIAVTVVSVIILTALAFVGVYILFRTKYNFTLLGMSLWLLVTVIIRLVKK